MPVWQYYYTYHYLNNINNNNNNNESTNIYENDHEIGQQTASFIKDTIASVLAQVCDCQLYYEGSSYSTADTDADIPTTTTTTKLNIWFPAIATAIISLNTSIGNILSIFLVVLTNVMKELVPNMDYLTCYGNCIFLFVVLLLMTIIIHQGLRILSVPSFLHHIVNAVSLSLFYGPQRTLTLFITTIMKMLMIVAVDDNYGDVNISSSSSNSNARQQQQQSSNRMMGCSFLLISLWVIMPLLSWIRTSTLYYEIERCVTKASPVDFETAIRKGKVEFKRWHWKQILIRYILLSMYSAIILWESID